MGTLSQWIPPRTNSANRSVSRWRAGSLRRALRVPLDGEYCRLAPLDPDQHAAPLFAAFGAEADARGWTYLAYGPFEDAASYRAWLLAHATTDDPLFFTIIDKSDGQPAGVASYLNINPAAGSIEVGHLYFAPRLRRSRAATEALYLLMKNAFELGYRRYEWKCNALNAPSRAAAERLGFTFEGLFRQAAVVKGRNRDTAWYSILDKEWPASAPRSKPGSTPRTSTPPVGNASALRR